MRIQKTGESGFAGHSSHLWCQQKAVIGYLKNEIVLLIMNSPSEFLSGNPMGCFLSRRRVYSDLYRHLGNGCAFRQSADIGIEKRFFFNQSRSNPLKKFSVFQKNVFGNPHIPLEFRMSHSLAARVHILGNMIKASLKITCCIIIVYAETENHLEE